jgi:uncharacterized membrane protein YadS
MVAAIPFMAFTYARRTAEEDKFIKKKTSFAQLLPLFIVGFLVCAALRSIGDAGINAGGGAFGLWDNAAWRDIYGFIKHWAVNFLVVALAGVGLSTSFRTFKGLGVKPFIVGLGAAVAVGVVSIAAISLLGTFVAL